MLTIVGFLEEEESCRLKERVVPEVKRVGNYMCHFFGPGRVQSFCRTRRETFVSGHEERTVAVVQYLCRRPLSRALTASKVRPSASCKETSFDPIETCMVRQEAGAEDPKKFEEVVVETTAVGKSSRPK